MFYGLETATPESVGVPSEAILAFMKRLHDEKRNVHGFVLSSQEGNISYV